MDNKCQLVDELIQAVTRKLEANRPLLERSLHFGRLTWRVTKKGDITVNLELKF